MSHRQQSGIVMYCCVFSGMCDAIHHRLSKRLHYSTAALHPAIAVIDINKHKCIIIARAVNGVGHDYTEVRLVACTADGVGHELEKVHPIACAFDGVVHD